MFKAPVLTIDLKGVNGEIRALGICEDTTVFKDAVFTSMHEALQYFKRYNAHYRVILNIQASARSI